MKTKLGLLALIFTINCYAHVDKSISKTYGNVKVYLRTGFDYAEFDKIKIVGKLSEVLSKRLKYKDTIFIEYIHDYTDVYTDDLYLLEYNNTDFKFLYGIKDNYKKTVNKNGLSVRINANKINIVNILKLVEFAIINKEKTNTYIAKKSVKHNHIEDRTLLEPLIVNLTDDKIIKDIKLSQSKVINDVISKKIPIKEAKPYGLQIYWINDTFVFEYNHLHNDNEILLEIKDYYYRISPNNDEILIFIDKNSFYFLDQTHENNKDLITINTDNIVPLRAMDFSDKILLLNMWNRKDINILLKKNNKIISKFE